MRHINNFILESIMNHSDSEIVPLRGTLDWEYVNDENNFHRRDCCDWWYMIIGESYVLFWSPKSAWCPYFNKKIASMCGIRNPESWGLISNDMDKSSNWRTSSGLGKLGPDNLLDILNNNKIFTKFLLIRKYHFPVLGNIEIPYEVLHYIERI